jgi:hypothetical protein
MTALSQTQIELGSATTERVILVLIPMQNNMAENMAGSSKKPPILFAMDGSLSFHHRSIWHQHGADGCPCLRTATKNMAFL